MSTEQTALEIARLLQIPALELHLQTHWGSDVEGHREQIRENLELRRHAHGEPGDSSISHAEGLGGFALLTFAFPEYGLGFDVELASRIRTEVARRVCLEEKEFLAAPSAAALWCAKEAAFKAAKGPGQPLTVIPFEIFDWQKAGGYESFRFRFPIASEFLEGKGLAWSVEPHCFAIALVNRRS